MLFIRRFFLNVALKCFKVISAGFIGFVEQIVKSMAKANQRNWKRSTWWRRRFSILCSVGITQWRSQFQIIIIMAIGSQF